MAKRARKMRELSLFQLWNQSFVLKPGIVNRRNHQRWPSWSWPRGCKGEQSPPCYPEKKLWCWLSSWSAPKRCCQYGEQKSRDYQLACAPFHILWGCAVVEDCERVCALKTHAQEIQPNFHLVLRAYITNIRGLFSPNLLGVMLWANVGQISIM